jgi:hypothetical protein
MTSVSPEESLLKYRMFLTGFAYNGDYLAKAYGFLPSPSHKCDGNDNVIAVGFSQRVMIMITGGFSQTGTISLLAPPINFLVCLIN